MIRADRNRHVGEGNTGDEDVMDRFNVKERNQGEQMVNFTKVEKNVKRWQCVG